MREVTYENVAATEPIKDVYGNETLEVRKIYSAPVTARWNVSAAVGEEANEIFGDLTDYSRTVTLCGDCPVFEGDRVTFGGQVFIQSQTLSDKSSSREVTSETFITNLMSR